MKRRAKSFKIIINIKNNERAIEILKKERKKKMKLKDIAHLLIKIRKGKLMDI